MRPAFRTFHVNTTPWVREVLTPDEDAAFQRMVGTASLSLLAVKRGGPFVGRMYHPVTGKELRAESVTLAGVLRQLIEQVDEVTA